jgi:hypothetical protein
MLFKVNEAIDEDYIRSFVKAVGKAARHHVV